MTTLAPRTLSFAYTAPWRFDFEGLIDATPAAVWAAFVDNESWTVWFKKCRECKATSPTFDGIGSTRHISVNGLYVDEEFIGWEPQKLWAFTAVKMRMSFAKAMVERARFDVLADGRTRIDYRMAIEPFAWAKPLRRLVEKQAAASFASSFANLNRYLADARVL